MKQVNFEIISKERTKYHEKTSFILHTKINVFNPIIILRLGVMITLVHALIGISEKKIHKIHSNFSIIVISSFL